MTGYISRNKKNRKKQLAVATALSMMLIAGSAAAQEAATETDFTFDSVVVTALRTESKDLDTPAYVQVYTQEQLKDTGAVNLFDALRFTNGVISYSYGPGGQNYGAMNAKLGIRGWERGTLVMIDGAPINLNDVYFLNTLPMDNIDRVEIVKRANSVLYGNDASGGVINIITKQNMPNRVSVTRGEFGRNSEALSFSAGQFSFSGTLQHDPLLKGLASNDIAFGDAEKSSLLWKYKLTDRLTLQHQHVENDHKHQKFKNNWTVLTEEGNYDYVEDYLRLRYDGDQWKINAYGNQSDRNTLTYKNIDTPLTTAISKSDRIKYRELGMDAQTAWKASDVSFIGGFGFSLQDYIYHNRLTDKHNVVDRDSYSLFLQGTKDIGNDITVIAGAREEWISSTQRKDLNAFCPQVQVLKKLDDSNSLYMNVSKSFKMPSFTSLYGGSSPEFTPNPDLTPEEGWSYEVGWKKATGNSLLKMALYRMDMDAITYSDVIVNGETVKKPYNNPYENTGFEVSYDKKINDRFSYNVGASYGNPKSFESGAWKRKFARQQYTGGVSYSYERWKASLTGSITADRAGDWLNMVPVNLNVRYAVTKDSEISMAVENLFNRGDIIGNWSSAASTKYYALPRNVRVTFSQNF